MTTIIQRFNPPLYWQQFEDLAVGLLREAYKSEDAQKNGGPGQRQDGVDVYGKNKQHKTIGIQCKCLSESPTREMVFADAEKTLRFRGRLKIWIFAITTRRDTSVQTYVDELNNEWKRAKHKCKAIVWFWDDCEGYINGCWDLQKLFYRTVFEKRSDEYIDKAILSAISTAFSRPAFQDPLHCETGKDFFQALKQTQLAIQTGQLIDRESGAVIMKVGGGYRQLHNNDFRDQISTIDRNLQEFRRVLQEGRRNGTILENDNFLNFTDPESAKFLNDLRNECLRGLNVVLRAADMPELRITE